MGLRNPIAIHAPISLAKKESDCRFAFDAPATWVDARAACVAAGADLVRIDTAADNDAVFARLVQALWKDIGDIRAKYACKQADTVPSGGQSPLAPALCKTLASLWSQTDRKVKACVDATFKPITGYALGICEQAREYVAGFAAAAGGKRRRLDLLFGDILKNGRLGRSKTKGGHFLFFLLQRRPLQRQKAAPVPQ